MSALNFIEMPIVTTVNGWGMCAAVGIALWAQFGATAQKVDSAATVFPGCNLVACHCQLLHRLSLMSSVHLNVITNEISRFMSFARISGKRGIGCTFCLVLFETCLGKKAVALQMGRRDKYIILCALFLYFPYHPLHGLPRSLEVCTKHQKFSILNFLNENGCWRHDLPWRNSARGRGHHKKRR